MPSQFIPAQPTNFAPAPAAIEDTGVVSIIRLDDAAAVTSISTALYRGGIRCFEVPLTADNAPEMIAALKRQLPDDAAVGAGTTLTAAAAENVIDAGASFVVSPHYVPEVADVCAQRAVAFIPGAFTPQEIYHAWQGGAAIVKVFSIRALGPEYLRDLAGPYPQIKVMPTGGVGVENAVHFIKAGACAVTIGRDLIGKAPWDLAALDQMTGRAEKLMAEIRQARKSLK